MTVVEFNAPHPLEQIFLDFEKKTGWKLSPQARIILKEGYNSVDIDTLGLGDYSEPHLRSNASKKVIELMPGFLEFLQKKGANRKSEEHGKVIGGVFVLQNAGQWRVMFGCTCWPI
jgi:hypothetical protein